MTRASLFIKRTPADCPVTAWVEGRGDVCPECGAPGAPAISPSAIPQPETPGEYRPPSFPRAFLYLHPVHKPIDTEAPGGAA